MSLLTSSQPATRPCCFFWNRSKSGVESAALQLDRRASVPLSAYIYVAAAGCMVLSTSVDRSLGRSIIGDDPRTKFVQFGESPSSMDLLLLYVPHSESVALPDEKMVHSADRGFRSCVAHPLTPFQLPRSAERASELPNRDRLAGRPRSASDWVDARRTGGRTSTSVAFIYVKRIPIESGKRAKDGTRIKAKKDSPGSQYFIRAEIFAQMCQNIMWGMIRQFFRALNLASERIKPIEFGAPVVETR